MHDPRAFWDGRYGEAGFAYGREPNDFVREVDGRIAPGPVLCLAEGEGRNAVFLAERGHDVTAVDLSAVGLDKARRLAEERGVSIRTVVGDLSRYEIAEGAWSAIVAIWMHVPPELRARVHRAAARGLVPGGALIIEAYTPRQLELGTGGPRDRALLVEPDELRAELSELAIETFEDIEREVHEGPHHEGRSAVVRAVARRGPAVTDS